MSLPAVLRPAAQIEFDDAVDWYESRRQGLGTRFATAVRDLFNRISAAPFVYPTVLEDGREALVKKYPYCVYYRVEAARVVVIAVFHTSRDPTVWQSRA